LWAWIAIIICVALIILAIVVGVFAFIRKSKQNPSSKKKSIPEPRPEEEKVVRVTTKREDPATEPMLIRAAPPNVSDTGYLEPRRSDTDNTANA